MGEVEGKRVRMFLRMSLRVVQAVQRSGGRCLQKGGQFHPLYQDSGYLIQIAIVFE